MHDFATMSEFDSYEKIYKYFTNKKMTINEEGFKKIASIFSSSYLASTSGLNYKELSYENFLKIASESTYIERVRKYIQIKIIETNANILEYSYMGQAKAISMLTQNEIQVFRAAELSILSEDNHFWWDTLANISQKKLDEFYVKLGQASEKVAYNYYKKIYGLKNIVWSSKIDSTLGYDLKVLIKGEWHYKEIKYLNKNKEFILTRNEYNKGTELKNWKVELWSHDSKSIAIEKSHIIESVPQDQLGVWDTCKISAVF